MKPSDSSSTTATSSSSSSSTPIPIPTPLPPEPRPSTSESSSSSGGGCGAASAQHGSLSIERRNPYSVICHWAVNNFPKVKSNIWSKYFEVGGYDCRLLIYPKGDTQALPGYFSIYLQMIDPRSSNSKWDAFSSYKLSILNHHTTRNKNNDLTTSSSGSNVSTATGGNSGAIVNKTVSRDSWHRFSAKKKSHGWCDFTPAAAVLDPKNGFLGERESIVVCAEILVLHESTSFSNDVGGVGMGGVGGGMNGGVLDVLSGKFTWKVHNFSLFKDMIKTQKIMSPVFPAGECNLRISVYQSTVNGVEYLSMCLESKDTLVADKSCWSLFRMSVLNQNKNGVSLNHIHRDSYGRFAADNKSGDNTSLGWNDYTKMGDFVKSDAGYLVNDTAVFSASFHVIKETSNFSKNGALIGGRNNNGGGMRKSDGYVGKFTWRIENFTRLKDLLKKRKITGLCIKSKRFQIGNRDCRLIVYPRGQSQPPCHLSVFLEVTDSKNTTSDWSCFVSHRLSVVNQKMEEKSVTKESQNRYSKSAKDWGWREFITLTSLFDQDSGFLLQDTVMFSAEVLILKETSQMQSYSVYRSNAELSSSGPSQAEVSGKGGMFTWKVENFLSFKEIMETRKIFSKFFQAGGCELRIGVYESFDTICIYLESDQSGGSDLDKNFWVRYRMAIVNHKSAIKTVWKESSICTKTWNNSVLQFMKVSDMLESDAGFLMRDTVVFVCEIIDCCPWFEFADLELYASEDERDPLSTDPGDVIDSEDSEGISGDEEDMFRSLLARAGFHLTYGDNPSQPQVTLREKLLIDASAIAGFLTGLRVYLNDPAKVKRLLLPTKLSSGNSSKKEVMGIDETSPSLLNLLMGVKVLQQAIIDLLLDIMVECCQPPEGRTDDDFSDTSSTRPSPENDVAVSPSETQKRESGATESGQSPMHERLDSGGNERSNAYAVQSSDMVKMDVAKKTAAGQPISPPETSAGGLPLDNSSIRSSKTKWLEHSEELLGLIVNSLRALDGVVPHNYSKLERRPQMAHKIALVLDRAPKHLQPDLVALIPKLVDQSEHGLAACALLDRLQKLDDDSSLRITILGALSLMDFDPEIWERVLFQCFKLLMDSHGERLATAMTFMFRAASQCQQLSQAVRVVRARLKWLGSEVSSSVLDVFSKSVSTWLEVAEVIIRDIDSDCGLDYNCAKVLYELPVYSENGFNAEYGCHFSDAYILIDLLCIPSLTDETCQIFERAVSRGHIDNHLMSMVLERRIAHTLDCNSEEEVTTSGLPLSQEVSFTPVLVLAESLALSRDPQVQDFVRVLYATLFRLYVDDSFREKMLKGLVDRATSTVDNCHEADLDFDILSFLIREEDGIAKSVLSMLRDIAELANVDRAALWHQLCVSEDENVRTREEMQAQKSDLDKEKGLLLKKLSEFEATTIRLKSDMKAESDRFSREKRELSDRIQEGESQLDWIRSERDEEIAKLSSEKKILRDRLHDADTQLTQLKSRKRDELKRVVKEKNALAERLKNAEFARKRFDEELKRCATETATREEVRKSLEDEVQRLTQTVGQTEGEKREKEEQVSRCEAYIDGMEAKLNACQQYIHTLESSLQEEMSRHAPLYGAGLDALSMKELETLTRIHEEGLRQIHSLQQRKGSVVGSPLLIPHSHGLYPNSPAHMAIGLPPHPNGVGLHSNGHVNGAAPGPWFNPT